MTNTTQTPSPWLDEIHAPCDPAVFLSLMTVWQEGANVPVTSPKKKQRGIYLTDVPLNRCAMFVLRHMRQQGIQRPQAYLWRLMNFGLLLEAAPRYGLQHCINGDEVHVALIHAAAVAKLSRLGEAGVGFDMEDVARHAAAFSVAEEVTNA